MTADVIPFPVRITDDVRISERWAGEEVPGGGVDGRPLVRLTRPVDYRARIWPGEGESVILVPAGFVTDFASIPWGVRNLFPPNGPWARPAIIHDLLYRIEGDLPNLLERLQTPGKGQPMLSPEHITAYLNETQARPWINVRRYTRAEADAVFREAMDVVGVPAWRRSIMYRAVRLGGGGGWGR